MKKIQKVSNITTMSKRELFIVRYDVYIYKTLSGTSNNDTIETVCYVGNDESAKIMSHAHVLHGT